MENEKGDVFRQFRDSFSKLEGHFHVLEQRIPVEDQMEYFKNSEQKRKANPANFLMDDEESKAVFEQIVTEETSVEEKKDLLTMLAISRSVKAYRLLEEYTRQPHPEVANWAYMALMESRISLESELSDEKQIYISTGLGGKDDKLRFYVLMLSKNNQLFQEYQRNVIEREFAYSLSTKDCEIEYLRIKEKYVELLFLVSVKANIKMILDQVIAECNQYGNFLSELFTITNVKELTSEEVEEIIQKDGNSKTSD